MANKKLIWEQTQSKLVPDILKNNPKRPSMKPVLLSVVMAAFLTQLGHLQPTQILPNKVKCDRWWIGKNPLLHYIQYIIVYPAPSSKLHLSIEKFFYAYSCHHRKGFLQWWERESYTFKWSHIIDP